MGGEEPGEEVLVEDLDVFLLQATPGVGGGGGEREREREGHGSLFRPK